MLTPARLPAGTRLVLQLMLTHADPCSRLHAYLLAPGLFYNSTSKTSPVIGIDVKTGARVVMCLCGGDSQIMCSTKRTVKLTSSRCQHPVA